MTLKSFALTTAFLLAASSVSAQTKVVAAGPALPNLGGLTVGATGLGIIGAIAVLAIIGDPSDGS